MIAVRIGVALATLERWSDLLALCEELDGARLDADQLRVSPSEIEQIASTTPEAACAEVAVRGRTSA